MHLEELSNEAGVSGNEDLIRKIIISALKPIVDDLTVDTMGNVYATKKAQAKTDLTVMITAHMDEVGFMITKVTGDGVLQFATVGGFDARILPGKSLLVGPNKLPGVIGLEAIHHTPDSVRRKVSDINSLVIDIGAPSKEVASAKVAVGDYAVFNTQFGHLNTDPDNSEQGVVKGKALDNRVGCAMLIEMLKSDYPIDVVGVFTVQEEVGLRGAQVAAHRLSPTLAVVLECTTADDLPPATKEEISYPRLGAGPCLTLMDRSYIPNRRLIDLVEDVAQAYQIPYQYKKPGLGGTDAGAIHKSRTGIPTINISVPSRYIHSPAALIELQDFWHSIKLVEMTLNDLPSRWQ